MIKVTIDIKQTPDNRVVCRFKARPKNGYTPLELGTLQELEKQFGKIKHTDQDPPGSQENQ